MYSFSAGRKAVHHATVITHVNQHVHIELTVVERHQRRILDLLDTCTFNFRLVPLCDPPGTWHGGETSLRRFQPGSIIGPTVTERRRVTPCPINPEAFVA